VAQIPTVLVADSNSGRRRELGLALYGGGYEVINAVDGEEGLRFTAGLDPTLVIVHTGLDGLEPLELHERVSAMGLDTPPFLVLFDDPAMLPEDLPEAAVYFLCSEELEPSRLLLQVRLLLLGREIGGELSDSIDVLYGDLTRISIGDLLRVLQKHVITGHVSLSVGQQAGIWLDEGHVVDAHWGGATGRKAFNRVASLRGGGFVLDLEGPVTERRIDVDLATLVGDAVDEKFQLDELYRQLPSLDSHLEVVMGDDFFSLEFSEIEREVLTESQEAKNFADLIDRMPATDLEVVSAVKGLHAQGILVFQKPEHKIHVVTDSTADLLPSYARRHHITVVPLSVLFGKEVFKDGIDLQPDEFYKRLQKSDLFPSTSPPSGGEFMQVYRRLIGSGDIVSVHISKKQSLTAENAEQAVRDGMEEFLQLRADSGLAGSPNIRIVDSRFNAAGLGLQVIFASRMARRGLALNEIVTRLEDISGRVEMLFVVNTLEYLAKGGRIGKARALIGGLLGIKPILGQVDGEVHPVDKVRGGRRAHPRIVELLKGMVKPDQPLFAMIGHASAPRWAGQLRELLVKSFNIAEIRESEIGPVVGAHAGPGTVGVAVFQPADAEELELLEPIESADQA